MGVFDNFPYTNFHDLNLDWLLQAFKKLQDEWDNFGYTVTANAVVGTVPSVEVTGDLLNGLNFKFTLVKGETGDTGPQGETGNGISAVSISSNYQITFTFTDGTSFTTPSLKGPQGEGLEVLDVYTTLSDLQTAHPSGNSGDMYLVGTSPTFILYIWSTSQNAWVSGGALSSPSPSATTPLMNGVADTGSEFAYARGDHRHPVDTSRASQNDLMALTTTVSGKADSSTVSALTDRVTNNENNIITLSGSKQNTLISGTNIKTIAGNNILGSGDLPLAGISVSDVHDSNITNTTSISRTYEAVGSGLVYASVSITTSSDSDSGTTGTNIYLNDTLVSTDNWRAMSAWSGTMKSN
ncbi:MAG: hypothetical protein IIZ74_09280, partial [Erysipelotrichaceae bacterium]|nr:hypothetical protein [Erysipelotrichaceae bacterium]